MRISHARRRARSAVGTFAALALTAVALAGCAAEPTQATPQTATPVAATTPTPTPTPLTAAEQLLADNPDVTGACAVSFVLDGTAVDPQLQVQDRLYDHLPIPRADGRAFAGWYADQAAAAAASADPATGASSPAVRVNGSRLVSCTDQQTTLYGAWTTPDAVAAAGARVPIMMYHQFTDKPGGEEGWLRGNYSYIEDYRASMQYIKDQAFYLPTWDELSAFIDGALYLPDHAVIVTDDDADPTWLTMASPINEQLQVMATSFDITGDGAAAQNAFILPRSHTHGMHGAGENGKGLMVNLTPEEIAADMTASADQLRTVGVTAGATEIMAYPFGHYDDRSKEGLRLAGFEMARTIEQGYVKVGTDKLALPCVRINFGMGVAAVQELIG
ncbi:MULTISPECIES: polysaccharide deacetylase family protein [unclassified Microbacterium]|uniref:polysaccharide deacetylase family protein n=1 Tax=unclassified Microbacterium TaxID=2609290 RepID=UPI0025CEA990|nr:MULTISPECIES: polysaccharide deacetylase family protein [unclassified Microbacterium]